MTFAEKGVVTDIEPAFFIGYLHRLKATGTLKFEDAPVQRAIYFRDGRMLFSSSNAPEDQLGAILVASGKIGQAEFDAIVSGLQPKQSIAAALAQGAHVSQRDIGDAARRKVEQIVGSCCVLTSGRYEFEDGVLPKGALDLKLTTEKVLISAFEALEPSGFLNRILKSPMAVLVGTEVEPEDPDLTRIRQALDGFSSLADIGGTVGLSLAATEVRAAVLVVMGAASVVSSQIEEMMLPDTGEAVSGDVPAMSLDAESESLEADTFSLVESEPAHSAPNDGDATLVMGSSEGPAYGGSPEATLVMGAEFEISADAGLEPAEGARPAAAKREKATTQDLAAIKELIGNSPAPPPEPLAPSSKPWVPMLSRGNHRGSSQTGFAAKLADPRNRIPLGVGLVAVLSVLVWAGYSILQGPSAPTATAVTAPAPLPAAQALLTPAAPTLVSPASTAALPSPPPAATPSPAAVVAPATPPLTSPAAPAVAKPTPVPTLAATPVSKPVEKPSPALTPKAPTVATPLPIAPSTPPPKAPGGARPAPGAGYEALKSLRLAEAAVLFEGTVRSRSSDFSVQLLVACSPETVAKAIQNDPSAELFILRAKFDGRDCHRLMRGFFKTIGEATEAVATLPPYYTSEGARPKAVPLKAVLR